MAITKVGAMTDPPVAGDYAILQAKLDAYAKQIGNQGMILTQWTNTTTAPKIAMGSYITHGGTLFVVDTEDYAVPAPAGDGTYYLKVAASGATLALSWVASIAGYTWNAIYNGLYHADESQILPYQLVKAGAVLTKRKITNLMQGSGFVTVDWTGAITGGGPIVATSLDTGHGANELYPMNQAVRTTDSPTFASVNTGQGATEVHLMNQNLRTTDSVHFANMNPPVDNNDTSLPAIGIGGFTFGNNGTARTWTMPAGGYFMVIGIREAATWIERVAGGGNTSQQYYAVSVFRLS